MSSTSRARLQLIGVALLFSIGGAAIKAAASMILLIEPALGGAMILGATAAKSWGERRVEASAT